MVMGKRALSFFSVFVAAFFASASFAAPLQSSESTKSEEAKKWPFLNQEKSFNKEKTFTQISLGTYSLDGLSDPYHRFTSRYHWNVFPYLSLGIGPDLGYASYEQEGAVYVNEESGNAQSTTLAIAYFNVALAGRAQLTFDQGPFSLALYFDYGIDLLAASIVDFETGEEDREPEVDTGGKNRRSSFGVNFHFDLPVISLGAGLEFGQVQGDFGDGVGFQGYHLVVRY